MASCPTKALMITVFYYRAGTLGAPPRPAQAMDRAERARRLELVAHSPRPPLRVFRPELLCAGERARRSNLFLRGALHRRARARQRVRRAIPSGEVGTRRSSDCK